MTRKRKDGPVRAYIYARFSPKPNENDEATFQTQIDHCRRYCEAKGYQVADADVYTDKALSGASTKGREGLEKALRAACKSRGILVVYSLSRLARNTGDALKILERLRQRGADLAMLDLDVNTRSPTGRFIYTLLAAFHALDREWRSAATADGLRRKFRAGERGSSQIPFGYRPDMRSPLVKKKREAKRAMHERFVPDKVEQAILAELRRLWESGVSLQGVADKLNALGMHRRGGKQWTKMSVYRQLQRNWEATAISTVG